MNTFQRIKVALAAIGILAVPAIGLSVVPQQDFDGLHTQNSRSDSPAAEGDSNPQPVPTVTRYLPSKTPKDSKSKSSGTCKVSLVIGPSPAIPAPTSSATPYAPVYGLAHTHSVQVKVPCPKETVTETPRSTK
jgi:hypothetical protein